jgi:hypothetical protein
MREPFEDKESRAEGFDLREGNSLVAFWRHNTGFDILEKDSTKVKID